MLQPQRVFVNANLPYINPDPFVFHFQLHFLDRHNQPHLETLSNSSLMSTESHAPSSASVPEQPPPPQPQSEQEEDKSQSKKAAKKEAAKQEKLRRRQEAALASAAQSLSVDEDDPLSANYGDVPLPELQSKVAADIRDWTEVGALSSSLKDKYVLVRGRAQVIRAVGKNMAFLVIREKGFTVQCVVTAQPDVVSRQMVKYAAGLSRESIVDIEGVVSVPDVQIKGATQQVCICICICK